MEVGGRVRVHAGHRGTVTAAQGLTELVRELRGPLFRDVNKELRAAAKTIAAELIPEIARAVRASPAPQADKVAATLRVHSDRVPVIVIGKVNPKLSGFKRRRGGQARSDPKRNRGAVAHGVMYGPLGGRRSTGMHENYYRIGRDPSGGPVGDALSDARGGAVYLAACEAYLRAFQRVLRAHGFLGDPPSWSGG